MQHLKNPKFILTLISLVFFVIATGCTSDKNEVLNFGDKAPDFESEDLDGNKQILRDYKGVPVVLRFFVPNCKYCRADTKIFNEYYKEYSEKGLKIVYINTDPNSDEVIKFVNELGIIFPVVLDHDQQIAKLFRVKVVPQTIVLDPNHTIIGAILGGVSKAELNDLLIKYLR